MKLFTAVLFVACLLSVAASADTVCTFDSFTGFGVVPDGYCGITWNGQFTYYDTVQPPYTPHSGAERIFPTNDALSGTFNFGSGVVFQGAWFAGYSDETVNFTLFYKGVEVAVSGSLAPTIVPTFLSSGYSGLVDEVTVATPGPVDHFILDDVTYTTSNTPEPASAMLVGAGVAAVMAYRRKRARS